MSHAELEGRFSSSASGIALNMACATGSACKGHRSILYRPVLAERACSPTLWMLGTPLQTWKPHNAKRPGISALWSNPSTLVTYDLMAHRRIPSSHAAVT